MEHLDSYKDSYEQKAHNPSGNDTAHPSQTTLKYSLDELINTRKKLLH
jgi:hypothetical protein